MFRSKMTLRYGTDRRNDIVASVEWGYERTSAKVYIDDKFFVEVGPLGKWVGRGKNQHFVSTQLVTLEDIWQSVMNYFHGR